MAKRRLTNPVEILEDHTWAGSRAATMLVKMIKERNIPRKLVNKIGRVLNTASRAGDEFPNISDQGFKDMYARAIVRECSEKLDGIYLDMLDQYAYSSVGLAMYDSGDAIGCKDIINHAKNVVVTIVRIKK